MKNSRRTFIATTVTALTAIAATRNAGATPTPTPAPIPEPTRPLQSTAPATPKPQPTPSGTPTPSPTARALAQWLQRTLRKANLSDALTEKIAGDIEGGFEIATTFQKVRLQNSDEPDFTFSA